MLQPRAALYCRLSKEDAEKQQESESIQNQKALLLDYAAQQGWQVCAVFSDEDYSGADRRRPGFNAMLHAAEAGRFEILLCKTQSRFARDLELVERYIHGLFPLWGIRFVAVVDNEDTARKGNKKARQISGLVNEWYLEDLSENVRAVLDLKRRSGQYIGSFAPYGYRKDPSDHNRLLVDPVAARTVQEIFRLFLSGDGKQRIAQKLNAAGVLCPSRYRLAQEHPGQDSSETMWSATAVGRILKSAVYAGDLVQGTRRKPSYKSDRLVPVPAGQWIVCPGTHQPIVSKETFQAVQDLLEARTRSTGRGEPHPLADRVRCLDCGGPLVKSSAGSGSSRRDYLHCKRHIQEKTACSRHSVRLDLLEQEIAGRIHARLTQYLSAAEIADLCQSAPGPLPASGLPRLYAALTRCERALHTLYFDRADGIIDREQFGLLNRSCLAEREQLIRKIAALAPSECCLSRPTPDAFPLRPFVWTLIEWVGVGERDPVTGEQRVEIHWNF